MSHICNFLNRVVSLNGMKAMNIESQPCEESLKAMTSDVRQWSGDRRTSALHDITISQIAG